VASLVSACLGAGAGCGWCVPFLEDLHRQVAGGEEKPDIDTARPSTPDSGAGTARPASGRFAAQMGPLTVDRLDFAGKLCDLRPKVEERSVPADRSTPGDEKVNTKDSTLDGQG
jgi:hypothetical protein